VRLPKDIKIRLHDDGEGTYDDAEMDKSASL